MIAVIQLKCLTLGQYGCFEFSIMRAAEIEIGLQLQDPLAIHARSRVMGYVDGECTVGDAGGLMGSIVGGRWTCLKAGTGSDSKGRPYDLPLDYQLRDGEHDIHRYELEVQDGPGISHTTGHFFYAGPGPLWDSCGESNTRTKGHLVSRRILRKIA